MRSLTLNIELEENELLTEEIAQAIKETVKNVTNKSIDNIINAEIKTIVNERIEVQFSNSDLMQEIKFKKALKLTNITRPTKINTLHYFQQYPFHSLFLPP